MSLASRFPMRLAVIAALGASFFVAAARPAAACSICRCGDPTFNSLGADVYSEAQFRLALDWDRFAKSQLTEENGRTGTDSEIEYRYTATLSYGFGDRFLLVARVPLSPRDLTTTFPGATRAVSATGRAADSPARVGHAGRTIRPPIARRRTRARLIASR